MPRHRHRPDRSPEQDAAQLKMGRPIDTDALHGARMVIRSQKVKR